MTVSASVPRDTDERCYFRNQEVQKMNRFLMLAALAGPALFAQTTQEPVVLTIDVENYVQYRGDIFDLAKIAKDPNPTTGVVSAFLPNITVGDIMAVNGKPAKGLWQQT